MFKITFHFEAFKFGFRKGLSTFRNKANVTNRCLLVIVIMTYRPDTKVIQGNTDARSCGTLFSCMAPANSAYKMLIQSAENRRKSVTDSGYAYITQ